NWSPCKTGASDSFAHHVLVGVMRLVRHALCNELCHGTAQHLSVRSADCRAVSFTATSEFTRHGPFNHPTEMIAHPNGDIYLTDGYRNTHVHRFTREGKLGRRRALPVGSNGEVVNDDRRLSDPPLGKCHHVAAPSAGPYLCCARRVAGDG